MRRMADLILAIDQGTTGSTAIVLDAQGHAKGRANVEFPQHFPKPGWVEHDPDEIWHSVLSSVSQALERANAGHAPAYGADDWTAAARDAIAALFETACDVFFVYTGTAANSLALAAMCRSTDAIVCHAQAHVNVDECGGPEFMSGGAKLLPIDTPDAKLSPDLVAGADED